MDDQQRENIRQGIETAFIDYHTDSNLAYRPEFVSNDHIQGRKVLTSIKTELERCDAFAMSVAFITEGGYETLLGILKEMEDRGVPGRVLTTDYQNFSDPKALRRMNELSNIQIRMYRTQSQDSNIGFHTKGYMFRDGTTMRFIVGSSNLTQTALTVNREWNTKLVSTEEGEFSRRITSEFEELWSSEKTQAFEEFIDDYETAYRVSKKQRELAKKQEIPQLARYTLTPNKMQRELIRSLDRLREDGEHRAILVSATGTGKTYASAFAMREEKQKRVLFLVHREQIARQAMESYQNVFMNTRTYGLLSGSSKDHNQDLLFSTMQTMSRDDVLHSFSPFDFQTIIIDEAHRTGAQSYQKIMEYFRPDFWLGMTASPERTDDFDVFKLFDHNIACEIRLQQALEEDFLCPFHYFGITDLEIDGEVVDEDSAFNKLVSDLRVDYVMKQAEFYGYSGPRVKGLIFCSRKEEARELSGKFNERGWKTAALSGDDSQEKRTEYISRLTDDDRPDRLDYLLTVDIFNESKVQTMIQFSDCLAA